MPSSITLTQNTVVASGSTTATLTGAFVGTPSADRQVLIAIVSHVPVPNTLNSVTVNTIAATKVGSSDVGSSVINEIWTFPLPTGTNADIVATFSTATNGSTSFGIFSLNNASTLASDSKATSGSAVSSLSLGTLNVPSDGVALYVSAATAGGTVTSIWTNATEQYDNAQTGTVPGGASAAIVTVSGLTAVTDTYSVTSTVAGLSGVSWSFVAPALPLVIPMRNISEMRFR